MDWELEYDAIERGVRAVLDEQGRATLKKPQLFLGLFNDLEPEHKDEAEALQTFFDAELGASLYAALSATAEEQTQWLKVALQSLIAFGMDEGAARKLLAAVSKGVGLRPKKAEPAPAPRPQPGAESQPGQTGKKEGAFVGGNPKRDFEKDVSPKADSNFGSQPVPDPTKGNADKKKRGLIIGGAAAACVVLLLVAFLAGGGSSKQETSAELTETVDTSTETAAAEGALDAKESEAAQSDTTDENATAKAEARENFDCIKENLGNTTGVIASETGDVSWTLYEDGTLMIWGDGKSLNKDYREDYADKIKTAYVAIENCTDFNSMFRDCFYLESVDLSATDLSNVTAMDYMFYGCEALTNLEGMKDCNVSNVESMFSMFEGCSSLMDLGAIGNWNVSGVSNMSQMFSDCSSLIDLEGIENWNVGNVTEMSGMFSSCSSLNDLSGIENWDVSSVECMSWMFSGCKALTDLSKIGSWDVGKVTDMEGMFASCSALVDLDGIANWDVSSVTNMSGMFKVCTSLTELSGIGNWNVSSAEDLSWMFDTCNALTDKSGIENWDVSNVTSMLNMFDDFWGNPPSWYDH